MSRHKDIHAGSLVLKIRGNRKYVYSVHRVGKKVLSVYMGVFHNEDVLRSFMEYHKARIQYHETKLVFHKQCLELAEKESVRMQGVARQLERYGVVVPNK